MKRTRRWLPALALFAPLLLAVLAWLGLRLMQQGGLQPWRVPVGAGVDVVADAASIERGRYLAALGNCVGCHTARGGEPLAGGRAFRTGYGTVYSSNLTPDREHGIGDWSGAEFRHAMRHGVSRNGAQSPVFPYASFRHLRDDDLDALFAWLRQVSPQPQPRRANRLDFPANLPGAMTAWRLLYYRDLPRRLLSDPELERGAYLVEGIGHCATCHAARGRFGSQAEGAALGGGRIAGWYAPPLHGDALARFDHGDVADYLRGGVRAGVGGYGLMADVIGRNLQHLRPADAEAIEAYLRTRPAPAHAPRPAPPPRFAAATLERGRDLYALHCADCHGARGEGVAGAYPPITTSSAVAAPDPVNLVKLILHGAVAPSTALNPQPPTMPPFAHALGADEVAALVNWLRQQADADARPVGVREVEALGGIE